MAVDFSKLDFGRKIGPLPLGAWVLIAGLGIGVYLYWRSSQSGANEEVAEEVEDLSVPAGVGEGPGWTAIVPPTSSPYPPNEEPKTNRAWLPYAINRVVSETDLNAVLVTRVATKYINEMPLTDRERTILKTIIEIAGSPPNPPQIHSKPDRPGKPTNPPKPPGPSPRDGKWHFIRSRSETLASIAAKYYANPQARKGDIFNANKQGANRPGKGDGWMRGPDDIQAQRWLWIPGPTKG